MKRTTEFGTVEISIWWGNGGRNNYSWKIKVEKYNISFSFFIWKLCPFSWVTKLVMSSYSLECSKLLALELDRTELLEWRPSYGSVLPLKLVHRSTPHIEEVVEFLEVAQGRERCLIWISAGTALNLKGSPWTEITSQMLQNLHTPRNLITVNNITSPIQPGNHLDSLDIL